MKTNHYAILGAAALAAIVLGSGTLAGQAPASTAGHNHIGHVMKTWKDTPNGQGFLPTAVTEAKVAATHAGLAAKSPDNLDSMKLHAKHVLHAFDPSIEMVETRFEGPGSGYGLKPAVAGALEHVQLAAKTEGASKNILTHAGHVSASLGDVVQWTDAAIATAQKIRVATDAAAAASLVTELVQQTNAILNGMDADKDGKIGWQTGEGGLEQAQMHMGFMIKGEGI